MIDASLDAFDTSLLGGPVFKARWPSASVSAAAAASALAEVVAQDAILVTVFAPCTYETNSMLQGLGFRLVSIRSTYERAAADAAAPAPAPAGVRISRIGGHEEALRANDFRPLAAVIGETSRYYKDDDIPRDKALAIYEAWLTNALTRGYAADAVLAWAGDALVGVNTLRLHGQVGTIDLIGVLPSHQNGGLGRVLLEQGVAACRERGAQLVRVVTEAENVGACRFYQRQGFVLTSTELVWHLHPSSADAQERPDPIVRYQ